MENEEKEVQLVNNQNNKDNFFIPDYDNQNLKNNQRFIKWKELMNKKYNGRGKIYKCPYDKNYFYEQNNDYKILCPSCEKELCCFCLKPPIVQWNAKCCLMRKICIMHYKGIEYSIPENRKNQYLCDVEIEIVFFLIPIINFLYFLAALYNGLFVKINSSHKNNNRYHEYMTYEEYLRENEIRFIIIMVINAITVLFLLLALFFLNIAISVLLLILIIIRRNWYMYLIGFMHEDWYFLNKHIKRFF